MSHCKWQDMIRVLALCLIMGCQNDNLVQTRKMEQPTLRVPNSGLIMEATMIHCTLELYIQIF